MFSINCLEITVQKNIWKYNQSLYKNLVTKNDYLQFLKKHRTMKEFKKRFFFNDYYKNEQDGDLNRNTETDRQIPENFFGDKINVQAIVGMNGSGKSSLIDLMYMAINNFAVIFTKQMPWPPLFVIDLYVTLYFSTEKNIYELKCEGSSVHLIKKDIYGHIIPKAKESFDIKNFTPLQNQSRVHSVASKFFYTIASSYAVFSFIPSKYITHCTEITKESWGTNKINASWMWRIFHKNDGYICPIVLNPKRENENDSIDVKKEMRLAKYRLLAFFIYAHQNNLTFDNRYNLDRIEISYRFDFVLKKIQDDPIFSNLKDENQIIKIVDKWITDDNSISKLLINKFNLDIKEGSLNIKKMGLIYLQQKIFSLPQKYPSYSKFIDPKSSFDIGMINLSTIKNRDNFEDLLEQIMDDPSHITTKIRQIVNFLSIEDNDGHVFVKGRKERTFNYDEYEISIRDHIDKKKDEWNNIKKKEMKHFSTPFVHIRPWEKDFASRKRKFSIDEIIECLPPSILDYKVFLQDSNNGKVVDYGEMSSGELQLLNTITTHLYHIRNIESIDGTRPQYNNINLIFDELEICLHPEYQRIFIKKLTDILINLKFNKNHFFNIFLVTHSPFVLSDLPQQRILYLKEGSQEQCKISPFAGNIGEMFYDSFFLKSTIGDFAETKIKTIVKEIKEKRMTADSPEVKFFINCIGDSVIKSLLKEIKFYDKN